MFRHTYVFTTLLIHNTLPYFPTRLDDFRFSIYLIWTIIIIYILLFFFFYIDSTAFYLFIFISGQYFNGWNTRYYYLIEDVLIDTNF